VEIVSTGTELLLGQIVNTNASSLAKQLNELGMDVLFQSTVGDNRVRMAQVLTTALSRADIVITTGGLGPTQGDITKEVSADLLGLKLVLHEPSLQQIQAYFASRGLPMAASNRRQAMMPEGAIVIPNSRGTAPGVILVKGDKSIIHLPGPPYEMEGMFFQSVAPYLLTHFGNQGCIQSKVLRTYGIGESSLEEMIADFIHKQNNPTIALLARNSEIHVRITAKASSSEAASQLIADLEESLRQKIGQYIFGTDDETLEQVVGRQLSAAQLTIALAESCTGGLLSSRLTDIPGSSAYFRGSVVCYSNNSKVLAVGVPQGLINRHGAVSQEVAEAMATGIKDRMASEIGVGITGIAGPGGAVKDKPVGLVYIAIAGPSGIKSYKHQFTGPRSAIKHRSANAALNYVRQFILSKQGG
jgi:nicotinamide-nucleotide amidase